MSSKCAEALHQLLVVVLDINPHQLLFARQSGSFSQVLNSVMSLLSQHMMLHPTNQVTKCLCKYFLFIFHVQVALVASHSSGCTFLYPDTTQEDSELVLRQQDGQYEMFYHLETVIKEKVVQVMEKDKGVHNNECLLSGALTQALCYVNKVQSSRHESEKFSPRLLVMSSTGDTAAQYINFMNVFFTAQKMNIPVDCCMLLQDSGLLQQGSDITGGLYIKVEQLSGLLQYLTWMFLPGPSVRAMLGAPPSVKVDYRAACFCHRQLVDVGFVCSVCLSIFCSFNPICTTCRSVFKAPGLPPSKKKKITDNSIKK